MQPLRKLRESTSALRAGCSILSVRGYRDQSVKPPQRADSAVDVLKYSVSGKDPMDFLPKQTDVLIIGGGIMGCSVAYWLKQLVRNTLSVTVLERDFTYKRSSTVLSVGGIRQQFSEPENVKMSLFGSEFLRNLDTHLRISGSEETPDVQYCPHGYLYLASAKGAEQLERNYAMQISLGAKVKLLRRDELSAKWPWMNVSDIELGCFGTENEGWFDGWLLLSAFRKKCLEVGVRFIYGEVVGFETKSQVAQRSEQERTDTGRKNLKGAQTELSDDMRRFGAVNLDATAYLQPETALFRTREGETRFMDAAIFVNAAGPFAGEVARMAGIGTTQRDSLNVGLPVEPRKRYVFSIHCPTFGGGVTPLIIDPSGAFFKREGIAGAKSEPFFVTGRSPSKMARFVIEQPLDRCPPRGFLSMPMLVDDRGLTLHRIDLLGHLNVGLLDIDANSALESRPLIVQSEADVQSQAFTDEEPDTKDLEVDHSFFEEKIWPVLAHRAPCFEEARVKSAWAGYYDYNVIDQNLIVGPHPVVRNLFFANGSSGHGIQHAPAIGRAVAEQIVHREYRTIDLSRFHFDRFLRNEPIFEKNVV